MRVKATVEYLGTAFAGWQTQPDQATVQTALENAIHVATGERVRVEGAGRTDAGVHASGQVAAFTLVKPTDLFRLKASLNGITPDEIAVLDLTEVRDDFDPRRDALCRTYQYTVISGRAHSPLRASQSWHVPPALDMESLQSSAVKIVGVHDFAAFRASDCEAPTTKREVFSSCWSADRNAFVYEVRANAYLKQMVRVLVGTMVDIALGKVAPRTLERLLEGDGTRDDAGRTAPACGLVLVSVDYE